MSKLDSLHREIEGVLRRNWNRAFLKLAFSRLLVLEETMDKKYKSISKNRLKNFNHFRGAISLTPRYDGTTRRARQRRAEQNGGGQAL